jgi:antitoxin component YwqK of YwqJK toxin-antitoxin module
MRFILLVSLMVSLNGYGQWKNYIISVKGDTLNRVDQKDRKQGPWALHVDELRGEPGYDEQGYYLDNKKEGTWMRFSLMGDKIAEENYRWGNLNGKCKYYTRAGILERVESWRAVNPDNAMDTVDVFDVNDPSKVVDRVIVKLEGTTLKHGNWTYYDPNEGTIEKRETYWLDRLSTGNGPDDELKPLDVSDGKSVSDTTGKTALKKPQVILDYEKKNAGKKKVKVRDGRTGY